MIAIGSYFAFIIFVMGTMLTAYDISEEERQQFYQEILEAHNFFRDWHNTKRLKLDQELCGTIKVHTDKLEANEETKLPPNYGLNVYYIDVKNVSSLNAFKIVSIWYSKVEGYDYFTEPLSPSKHIGAFTQMVWENTENIGVGMWIKDDVLYVVVAYSPPGNQIGHYLTNVLQPGPIINPDNN